MDIIRRNTDYAFRTMVYLALHFGEGPTSTKEISNTMDVPYQLACKLMQQLHKSDLVESCMGPKGGFKLTGEPSETNLLEIIEAIQGPISLNRCLLDVSLCSQNPSCLITKKLVGLQEYIENFFKNISLAELLKSHN